MSRGDWAGVVVVWLLIVILGLGVGFILFTSVMNKNIWAEELPELQQTMEANNLPIGETL